MAKLTSAAHDGESVTTSATLIAFVHQAGRID
jgi:hypothetical protein